MSCSKAKRQRQRDFRKDHRNKKEEPLDRRNLFGILDETPAEAVKEMNRRNK